MANKPRLQSHPTPKVVSQGTVSRPHAIPKPSLKPKQPSVTRRVGPFGSNKNG